jgi:hypothetical protein
MAAPYRAVPYLDVFPGAANTADAWTVVDAAGLAVWRDPQAAIPMFFHSETAARQTAERLNTSGEAHGPA